MLSDAPLDAPAQGEAPIPSSMPGLPVWTDDLGRECRLYTGLDHPPTSREEAATVMKHGLVAAGHGSLWQQWLDGFSDQALKAVYLARARMAHPDTGGSTEAFKLVQMAYFMLKRGN
jgi:hypothetical protein